MRTYLKYIALLVVFACFSAARAGSYEDYFAAIERDHPGPITALLQRGFDPDSRDPRGQTGLTLAALNGSWRAIEALLAHPGIDVNALNASGESVLMLAALKGELAWCERLVARGARVQKTGWAPIHYAATGPNAAVVEFMLAKGADINAASPNGSTPLMLAARYGSEESVNLLLARGADATRRNDHKLSAADFARQGGREALANRLARP